MELGLGRAAINGGMLLAVDQGRAKGAAASHCRGSLPCLTPTTGLVLGSGGAALQRPAAHGSARLPAAYPAASALLLPTPLPVLCTLLPQLRTKFENMLLYALIEARPKKPKTMQVGPQFLSWCCDTECGSDTLWFREAS